MRKRNGGRRRIYQMPVEILADNQLAMTLPAAAFGMTARLILHFHISGCRPLPIADHELKSIARAHAPTWRHWKPQVMEVVNACLPEIEAYTRKRNGNRQGLSSAGQIANSTKRLNALRLQTVPAPTPISIPVKPSRPPAETPTDKAPRRAMTDRRR